MPEAASYTKEASLVRADTDMAKFRPLQLQRLDDRRLLAAFGIAWPEATALTLSFAPDGTAFGQQSSALFGTLDSRSPTRQWEREILRAFQTWAVPAGIDIGLVADGGQPLGTTGLKQGDARFGDIRIGALTMAGDVLAVANPFDPFVANTGVGDVYLNSSVAFSTDKSGAAYDLFSVMLHEAGHVLGLDHSPDPSSVMFENFRGVRTGLSTSDVAAVRALYGNRADATSPAQIGHSTRDTATLTNFVSPLDGSSPAALAEGDLVAPGAGDFYRLDVRAESQSLEIQVTAAGISLLVPQVTVYNAAGAIVASAEAVDPLSNNLRVSIDRVTPGESYYVKVAAARSDVFGVGRYRLEAVAHQLPVPLPPQNGAVPGPSGRGGSPLDNVQLLVSTPGYVEHTYYEMAGTLDQASPLRVYQVRSADIGPNLANVMTVAVQTSDVQGAPLQVTVLDDHGLAVTSRTIFAGGGHLEIQVLSVLSNRDYLVQLSSVGSNRVTDFRADVDFNQDAANRQPIAAGLLESSQNSVVQNVSWAQSGILHFSLAASHWNTDQRASLRMTILDDAGRAVYRLDIGDGAIRSGDVFLNQGRYQLRFERSEGGVGTPLRFELSGLELSDPLGPQLRDATREPLASASASAVGQLYFYWLPVRASDVAPSARNNLVPAPAAVGNGTTGAMGALALPPVARLPTAGFGVTDAVARESTLPRSPDGPETDPADLTTDGLPTTQKSTEPHEGEPATSGGTVQPPLRQADPVAARKSLLAGTHPNPDTVSVRSRGAASVESVIESGVAADAALAGMLPELSDEMLGLLELVCLTLAWQLARCGLDRSGQGGEPNTANRDRLEVRLTTASV